MDSIPALQKEFARLHAYVEELTPALDVRLQGPLGRTGRLPDVWAERAATTHRLSLCGRGTEESGCAESGSLAVRLGPIGWISPVRAVTSLTLFATGASGERSSERSELRDQQRSGRGEWRFELARIDGDWVVGRVKLRFWN